MPGLNYPGEPAAPPSGDEVFNLTSAPEGGWSAIQQGKAVYYNGKTYFGWINGSTGALKVASYDHAAETTSSATQVDSMGGTVDDHNNPGILVRDSDKKILVAFCLHNGANMFLSISSSAESIASFGAASNLDSSIGASDYTYPALFQLTSVTNDPIYLFYRDQSGSTGRLAYSKSTDGGATWSARTVVMTAASTFRSYWTIVSDGLSRIDVFATDRAYGGDEGVVDLGHMYMDGTTDKWYTSAAVEITATKPFNHSELTQIETNVTATLPTDAVTSANPVVAYFVESGSDLIAKYGRWDGSSWDKGTIYTEDPITFDAEYGFLAINRADIEEVFSGVSSGVGTSELKTYVSADLGATWDAGTAITTGSADYNVGVIPVINGVAGLPCMWLRGTWTSSSDYSWAIKGLRR